MTESQARIYNDVRTFNSLLISVLNRGGFDLDSVWLRPLDRIYESMLFQTQGESEPVDPISAKEFNSQLIDHACRLPGLSLDLGVALVALRGLT